MKNRFVNNFPGESCNGVKLLMMYIERLFDHLLNNILPLESFLMCDGVLLLLLLL